MSFCTGFSKIITIVIIVYLILLYKNNLLIIKILIVLNMEVCTYAHFH
jgi:hypothetical protein